MPATSTGGERKKEKNKRREKNFCGLDMVVLGQRGGTSWKKKRVFGLQTHQRVL